MMGMERGYIETVHVAYDQNAYPGKAPRFTAMWVTDHGTLHVDAKDMRHAELIAQSMEAVRDSALGADVTLDVREGG